MFCIDYFTFVAIAFHCFYLDVVLRENLASEVEIKVLMCVISLVYINIKQTMRIITLVTCFLPQQCTPFEKSKTTI